LSINGVVGFVTAFGPLLIPVLWARRRLPEMTDPHNQLDIAGVAFMLTILCLDLIPNGLWAPYPFFIAGALTRRIREIRNEETAPPIEPVAASVF
jgi:hypothetical protein